MNTHSRSTVAARQTRRRFLKGMGLGAVAAPLVLGVGDLLIGRALGQTTRRKMALFFVHGECWAGGHPEIGYTPPGVKALVLAGPTQTKAPVAGQEQDNTGVEWPTFAAPLAPFKDRMVIIDGLVLTGIINDSFVHGYKFATLSAAGSSTAPSQISIDQHVAGVLGRDTPVKSLLFGLGGGSAKGDEATGAFTAGPGVALKHAQNANTLLLRMTGAKPSVPGGAPTTVLGTRVLDMVREDLKRLERGLAAEEKAQLTEYLTSMEAFQKKEQALGMQLQMEGCKIPGTPMAGQGTTPGVVAFDSMFRLSTLALKCGVTNVIGVAMGNTESHNDLDLFVPNYESHANYIGALRYLAPISMGWVATMLKDLGPLADSMTVTIVPGNGMEQDGPNQHHGCPTMAAMVFDGPRALRTGARFLRVKRNMADLYTTLAGAVGAPVDKFNNAGAGRINELLA